ncbi:MAG: hypothetical protein K0S00_3757 [Xanthobacteraceae bacterium]|jgi:uncharacterized protein (DUF2336 family)|nr:hypothetical protein [Xanthobacteraceae bacterium]
MSSTSGPGPSDSNDQLRRPAGDTRPEMLRLLVREFVKRPIRNEAAEARFVTLAARLIEAVDTPVAARVVRELAPHPEVPRALVLHLATAPLSIAGPFLRLSPVLDEADLAHLAESAGPSHLAAMAARRDVSPTLAKRIAELVHRRGEESTQAEAAIEAPAEEMASERMEGGDDQPVVPPVEAVPEAPVAVEAEATVVIEPTPGVVEPTAEGGNPKAATEPEATVPPTADTEAVPAPAPLPPIDYFAAGPEERAAFVGRLVTLPPLPLAERTVAPPPGFIDMLLDAAKASSAEDVAGLLERTLGITEANAQRIVADATGEALAVAARALGLSFAILSRVLFRLHPVTGRSAAQMTRLAEMFDGLPTASAQHLVASWRAGRRISRERAEEAPSMRSFAQPHAAQQAATDAADRTRRNG